MGTILPSTQFLEKAVRTEKASVLVSILSAGVERYYNAGMSHTHSYPGPCQAAGQTHQGLWALSQDPVESHPAFVKVALKTEPPSSAQPRGPSQIHTKRVSFQSRRGLCSLSATYKGKL